MLATIRGVFPPRPEETAVRQSLASAYRSIGKAAEALRLFEEVHETYRVKLGTASTSATGWATASGWTCTIARAA